MLLHKSPICAPTVADKDEGIDGLSAWFEFRPPCRLTAGSCGAGRRWPKSSMTSTIWARAGKATADPLTDPFSGRPPMPAPALAGPDPSARNPTWNRPPLPERQYR